MTPRIAYSASDTMHFRAYTQNTLGFTVNVYWSASLDSAKWTGWTSIDTINVPTSPTGRMQGYIVDLGASGSTGIDTGYVAFDFTSLGGTSVGSSSYTTNYIYDVVHPNKLAPIPVTVTPSTTPAGYTLEKFDNGFTGPDLSLIHI